MPESSSNPGNQTENRGKGKKPHDANVHAFSIVQQAIGEKPKEHSAEKPEKNPAAVTLGYVQLFRVFFCGTFFWGKV